MSEYDASTSLALIHPGKKSFENEEKFISHFLCWPIELFIHLISEKKTGRIRYFGLNYVKKTGKYCQKSYVTLVKTPPAPFSYVTFGDCVTKPFPPPLRVSRII